MHGRLPVALVTVRGAVFLGIGAMVGAGIFALLGEAAVVAGSAVWLSLVGIAAWLGYLAAIMIVCSMAAVAFGSYATALFVGDDAGTRWDNVFASALVVSMAAINMVGSRVVDRAQSLIVVLLLVSSQSSSP